MTAPRMDRPHATPPTVFLYTTDEGDEAVCFLCHTDILSDAIAVHDPDNSIDLHPDCARQLATELNTAAAPVT